MRVRPIEGEPTRFYVESESGAKEYLVDLLEYGGNGKCDCPFFLFNLEPKVSRGSANLRCKHLHTARSFWCEAALTAMSQAG